MRICDEWQGGYASHMRYGREGRAAGHRRAAVVEPKPGKPGNSGEPTQFATGLTSIFVGAIPKAVTDDQLQVMLGTKAHIGRRHGKAKFGYAKILIPNEDMDRVLRLDLSVSGHKFRVAKWRSLKAPSHRVPAFVYDTNRRNGHFKSEVAMKEQARFVVEFLDAQARPGSWRLYSQVASNTAEARMKSMETAIYDVRQLLQHLSTKPRK